LKPEASVRENPDMFSYIPQDYADSTDLPINKNSGKDTEKWSATPTVG